MKKTLCIILSAVLIISACIFSVNAVTVPQIDTSPSIDMPEFVYCEEGFNILYQFDDPSGITRTFCYLCSGQNPDDSYFTLLADYGGSVYCGDAVKYYELDGYTLVSPREYLPGYYYILADGKMSELSYAYEHEMFDSDALYEQLIKCDDKPGVWSKNANLIVTSPNLINKYENNFTEWSVSKYGENCLSDGYSYKELYTHYNGGEPDWVLVEAHFFHPEPDLETFVHIGGAGGRTIFGPTIGSPFLTGYGVYDVKAGEFYGFEQFADNDCSFFTVVDKLPFDCTKYDGLLDALANLNIGEITGDANNDKSMDILDAAEVQKASSEKIKLDKDSEALGDVNSDYKTDVLDASIIQMALVAE